MEPKVVFEDEFILVLEKPAGMVVNRAETTEAKATMQDWVEKKLKMPAQSYLSPSGAIRTRLKERFWAGKQNSKFKASLDFVRRSGIVHRLDKETSGLLLVAKTPEAFIILQKQFKERKVKKRYLALVHGKVAPEEGEIKAPVGRLPWNRERFGVFPGGREAETKYKVIRHFEVGGAKWDTEVGNLDTLKNGGSNLTSRKSEYPTSKSKISHFSPLTSHLSLLELSPRTGRTHQVRVHLKYLGFPIVADEFYAGRKTSREDRKWCPRLFLHASYLGFLHPETGKWVEFESDLPSELKEVIVKVNGKRQEEKE